MIDNNIFVCVHYFLLFVVDGGVVDFRSWESIAEGFAAFEDADFVVEVEVEECVEDGATAFDDDGLEASLVELVECGGDIWCLEVKPIGWEVVDAASSVEDDALWLVTAPEAWCELWVVVEKGL